MSKCYGETSKSRHKLEKLLRKPRVKGNGRYTEFHFVVRQVEFMGCRCELKQYTHYTRQYILKARA